MGRRLSEPQPVLDLLTRHDGLIVLGDPGAGKTTFLKFLTLTLATGQGEALGIGVRLPVLVPLAAYAAALAENDVPLDRFITQYYRDRGVELPIDALLAQALAQGGALLLLDGLDEVKDISQRGTVVNLVTDFYAVHRRAGNKFVLTSRVVGYSEVRPQVEGLAECTLVDFDDEDIKRFVAKWTAALEKAACGETQVAAFEASQEQDELLAAIERNPGVRALAVNPLLLTILALMKRQGVTLPERRVELYQRYVETLVQHWNLARSLAGRGGRDLDVVETLQVLAPLALWMHRTSPGVGLVKESDLYRELEAIYRTRRCEDPERATRAFLEDVRGHTGLLLSRGGRQYGFIHLTFQEYLAAVAVARKGQQGIAPIVEELAHHIGDDTWHEASLLTVGYLGIVQQRDEAAGEVLETLIQQAPGEPGEAVVLAGEAAADAGTGGIAPVSRQRVVDALLKVLHDDKRVTAARRAVAGRVLGACGDPRPEVMTLEGMAFCLVPAGLFLLGSGKTDADAVDWERPQREYPILYDYWISRYPVTVAQFRAYVEARGSAPEDPNSLKGRPNTPVVWVSWREAHAFCRWLTARWREEGRLPAGQAVALPSEPEWEKAARGGLEIPEHCIVGSPKPTTSLRLRPNPAPARRYPWGDDPDPNRANYYATEVGEPSTPGCFPGGASPYGCEDLSGNVWEWTRSLWGGYPYPSETKERERRESLSAKGSRVLRGGAFDFGPELVRCAARYYSHPLPDSRLFDSGFRVVVSPFFSGR